MFIFSKDMLFKTAEAMSLEARAFWQDNVKNDIYEEVNGLSCFNPIVNIMRHPLWGRNQVRIMYYITKQYY